MTRRSRHLVRKAEAPIDGRRARVTAVLRSTAARRRGRLASGRLAEEQEAWRVCRACRREKRRQLAGDDLEWGSQVSRVRYSTRPRRHKDLDCRPQSHGPPPTSRAASRHHRLPLLPAEFPPTPSPVALLSTSSHLHAPLHQALPHYRGAVAPCSRLSWRVPPPHPSQPLLLQPSRSSCKRCQSRCAVPWSSDNRRRPSTRGSRSACRVQVSPRQAR